jgi:hypothetical protein
MEVIFEPEPDVPESERGTIASQIQRLLKEKNRLADEGLSRGEKWQQYRIRS